MRVVLDGQQRYWVLTDDRVPLVLDPNGRFLSRVSRQGAGPGELASTLAAFAIPGDSVVLLDQVNLRAQVVGPDLRPARALTIQWRPMYKAVVKRWPDSVIMTSTVGTPDGAGWPLHLLSFAGRDVKILKSFGPGSRDPRMRLQPFMHLQPLAASRSGAWSVSLDSYDIYRWTDAGRLRETLKRRPSWFAEQTTTLGIGHPDEAPPPYLADIVEDSAGLIWVAARAPSDSWRTAWNISARRPRTVGYTAKDVDMTKLWRTMIEVIDPATRVVVRRFHIDDHFESFLTDGSASVYGENINGEPRYQVVRWSLVRR